MIAMTFIHEDHVIHAKRSLSWEVTIVDNKTGSEHDFHLDDDVWAAILALAVGGEEIPGALSLYKLVEKSVPSWGQNNMYRIIP